MRVWFFINSLDLGGAQRVTVTLANHWAEGPWQVGIVTLGTIDRDRYALHPMVARVGLGLASESASLLGALLGNWRRIRAVRRMLRKEQPDAVVAMMGSANVVLALASLGMRETICIGSERIHPPRLPLPWPWDVLRVLTYRWLDIIVTLTVESQDWVRAHTSAPRVVVIPNPVTWPVPGGAPVRPPGSVGSPESKRLLSVGRLDPQKGFDLLLEVFARLVSRFPDWELVIVGEGPSRKELEARIAALHLGGTVRLPGEVGNIGEWYSHAHLYALTSRFEGFPNALVEAMACGLPVVSVNCETGPRDIIRHEVDGLLVAPGDEVALERALARLMGDPECRAQFAGRAVEVRERFALDRVSHMWAQLFEESPR